MITLNILKKLNEANREKFIAEKGDRLVKISSHHGWYREHSKGYCGKETAWVLPLKDAIDETYHCGPEKQIEYHFV